MRGIEGDIDASYILNPMFCNYCQSSLMLSPCMYAEDQTLRMESKEAELDQNQTVTVP